MTDSLRTRIAAVLREHQPAWGHATLETEVPCDACLCGWDAEHNAEGHQLHLADAVIRELGLRQDTVGLLTRYVTEWVQ